MRANGDIARYIVTARARHAWHARRCISAQLTCKGYWLAV